jgi:hypothetical protein
MVWAIPDYLYGERQKSFHRGVNMWRLAVIFVPVTLIFFVAQMAVLGASREVYSGEYPDPFALYEGMMPGEWLEPGNPPCELHPETGIQGTAFYCVLHSRDREPIVSVSSNIFDHRFAHTVFVADDLYVGDIVRHWGQPDMVERVDYRSFNLIWTDQELMGFVYPVGQIGRFSYMMPVQNFTIGLLPDHIP